MLFCDLFGLEERLLRAGVDGVGADGGDDQVVAFPPLREGLGLFDLVWSHIEEDFAEEGPQPPLLRRPGRLVHEVVHVVVADDPRPDHLQAAELHPPMDILGRQLRLQGPDLLLQPRHQLHVVGVTPKEGHGQVGVGVD